MKLIPTTCSMLLVAGVIWVAPGIRLMAQDRTTTTVTQGQPITTTQVERAEVVYVSGNELVVKMDTGEVRSLTVPDTAKAMVDGKEVTVHDLEAGYEVATNNHDNANPEESDLGSNGERNGVCNKRSKHADSQIPGRQSQQAIQDSQGSGVHGRWCQEDGFRSSSRDAHHGHGRDDG